MQEEAPTRTGTFTRAALPTPRSHQAGPEPGYLGDGDHSAPGGCCYPPAPRLPGFTAPGGRTHLCWEVTWETPSYSPRHRARGLARAAPSPGAPRPSALCRPAEELGRSGWGPEARARAQKCRSLLASWQVRVLLRVYGPLVKAAETEV